jgi:hypothetical protein
LLAHTHSHYRRNFYAIPLFFLNSLGLFPSLSGCIKAYGITTFVSNEVSWKKFLQIATISWPVEIVLSRIYQNRRLLLLKSWVLLDSIFGLIQQRSSKALDSFVIRCKQPLHMNSPNAMLAFVGGGGGGGALDPKKK